MNAQRLLSLASIWLFAWSAPMQLCAETLQIARGDEQYPPYEWVENGQPKGIHIELIGEAARQLSIPIEFVSLPWSRALLELEAGHVAALTFLAKTTDRAHYTDYEDGNILSTAHLALFRRINPSPFILDEPLTQLARKHVAVRTDFFYGDVFQHHRAIKKMYVKSYKQMLKLVLLDRVDFGIVNRYELLYEFKNDPKLTQIEFISPAIAEIPSYLGFSKHSPHRSNSTLFANQISRLRASEFYTELLKRYGMAIPAD